MIKTKTEIQKNNSALFSNFIITRLVNFQSYILILFFGLISLEGYSQCSTLCTIDLQNDGTFLNPTPFVDEAGGGDIDIVAGQNTPTSNVDVMIDVLDPTMNCLKVSDAISDYTFNFEIEAFFDVYGGGVLETTTPYGNDTGTTGRWIIHDETGFKGQNTANSNTSSETSTGDVSCYNATIEFSVAQEAQDVDISMTSINTAGQAFESASIVVLDDSNIPYGSATYNGFWDGNPQGSNGGTNTTNVNTEANIYTTTGNGVWIAADPSTTDVTDPFNTTAGVNGINNNATINASSDAGLAATDMVGGFVYRVCLEDVATTAIEDDQTTTATNFTSTLNDFSVCNVNCQYDVTCPVLTDLGSFDCNQLDQIPDLPTNVTTAEAAPYNIDIGDMPCDPITVSAVDDIAVDVCVDGGQTITRTVTITDGTNTTDCVFTYNILEDDTNPFIMCPTAVTLQCVMDIPEPINPVSGQFVRVSLVGPEALSLAEVEVYSAGVNVALTGVASQSSLDFGGLASRAIDGNTDGIYANNSVTHTTNEPAPFWIVDLGAVFSIDEIRVFNRTDACCVARLDNYTLEILDDVMNVEYSKGPNPAPDVWHAHFPSYDIVGFDNCVGDLTPTYVGDISDGLICPENVTRTFRLTDACGNFMECEQLFVFDDTQIPAFVDPPENIASSQGMVCGDPIDPHALETTYAEGFPTISDNCLGMNITPADLMAEIPAPWDGTNFVLANGYEIAYSDFIIVHPEGICTEANQRKYRIERTWTITDPCGNTRSSDPEEGGTGFDFQRINVNDGNRNPVVRAINGSNVFTNGSCEVTVNAIDLDAGSVDNCGLYDPNDPSMFDVSTTLMIRVAGSGDPLSPSLTFDMSDFDLSAACPAQISLELWVTDECGNSDFAITAINIQDNTPPTISCIPDVSGLDCNSILPLPATDYTSFVAMGGAISDGCSGTNVSVTSVDDVDPTSFTFCQGDGPFEIERTYTITDECGNLNSCIQLISYDADIDGPTIISCPDNVILECPAEANDANPVINGQFVRISIPSFEYLSVAEVEVYSAGTNLALSGIAMQSSNFDPVTGLADLGIDGNRDGDYFTGMSVTATSNTDVSPFWMVDLGGEYDLDEIRIFNRTDCCPERLNDYTLEVLDVSMTPVYSSGPNPAPDTWSAHFLSYNLVASDNCVNDMRIELIAEQIINPSFCETKVMRTYVVVDECGNSSDPCVQTITISDTTPPVFTNTQECMSYISPISASSPDMGTCCSGGFAAMIDGSGLASNNISDTHDCSDMNMWSSLPPNLSGQLDFDLGGLHMVSEIAIWNSGQTSGERGIKDIMVSISTNGIDYSLLPDSPNQVAQAPCPSIAEIFSIHPVEASHIRIDILSSWSTGGATSTGIAEIKFGVGGIVELSPVPGGCAYNNIIDPPAVTEECSFVTVSNNITGDDPLQGDFLPCEPFEVIWTATDFCGNRSTCVQKIFVLDNTAPDFVAPPENIDVSQGLTCGDAYDPHSLETRFGEGFPEISDPCLASNILASDLEAEIASPWDGTSITLANDYIISYSDSLVPHPGGLCTEDEQRKYRIYRFWTITDPCGNTMTSDPDAGGPGFDFQRINFGDGPTAPTAVAIANPLNIGLTNACNATIVVGMIEDGSFDNCGINDPKDPSVFDVASTAEIRILNSGDAFTTSLVLDQTDFDLSMACPAQLSIELQVTDECGNTGTSVAVLLISDETDPMISACPGPASFEGCDENDITAPHLPYSDVEVVVPETEFTSLGGAYTDNCGIASVTYRDALNNSGCPSPTSTITRTWTITDHCGNAAGCNQTLSITDTTAPSYVDPPNNVSADQGLMCGDAFDPHSLETRFGEGFPEISDPCLSANITPSDLMTEIPEPWDGTEYLLLNNYRISFVDDIVPHPEGLCTNDEQRKYRINRTWTITDPCGNSMSSDPMVGGTGFDFQRINIGDAQNPEAVARDLVVTLNSCTATLLASDFENGSTDNCGVDDPNDPSNFNVAVTAMIRIKDSGDAFSPTLTIDGTLLDFSMGCSANIIVELMVSDECGNTDVAESMVEVQEFDIPNCQTQDITLIITEPGQVFTVSPQDIDNGSSDLCSGISMMTVTPNVFDCDDTGITEVVLTVTDNACNTSSCTANVTLIDGTVPVCVVQDITVNLDDNGEVIVDASQVDDGTYTSCGADFTVEISPSMFDCDDLGDVIVDFVVTTDFGETCSTTATITVEDNTPPVVNFPPDITVMSETEIDLDGENLNMLFGDVNSVMDNCPGEPNILTMVNGRFVSCSEMEIVRDWIVYDSSGNSTEGQQVVTVLGPVNSVNPDADAAVCWDAKDDDPTGTVEINGNADVFYDFGTIISHNWSIVDDAGLGLSEAANLLNSDTDIVTLDVTTVDPITKFGVFEITMSYQIEDSNDCTSALITFPVSITIPQCGELPWKGN